MITQIKENIKQLCRGFDGYYELDEELDNLILEFKRYKVEVSNWLNNKDNLINNITAEKERLVKILTELKQEDVNAKYWNNKWKKNKLTYSAQGTIKRDPRTLVCTKSHLINKIFTGTDDEKTLKILKFVKGRTKYKGDPLIHKKAEFWQHAEETYQRKTGDCEDCALLILSLMRMNGIPAYRCKICAGWVQINKGKCGHAYVIFLASDNRWYVLDWCYWYSKSISRFRRQPHNLCPEYLDIWWTFNDEYTWAQTGTIIDEEK